MSGPSPAYHGVTIEQYTGVTAALADAFPLRAALDEDHPKVNEPHPNGNKNDPCFHEVPTHLQKIFSP